MLLTVDFAMLGLKVILQKSMQFSKLLGSKPSYVCPKPCLISTLNKQNLRSVTLFSPKSGLKGSQAPTAVSGEMRQSLASCWCHLLINTDLPPCLRQPDPGTTLGETICDFKARSICKISGTTVQAQWTVVPLTSLHISPVSEYYVTAVIPPISQNIFADLQTRGKK